MQRAALMATHTKEELAAAADAVASAVDSVEDTRRSMI